MLSWVSELGPTIDTYRSLLYKNTKSVLLLILMSDLTIIRHISQKRDDDSHTGPFQDREKRSFSQDQAESEKTTTGSREYQRWHK